MRNQYCSAGLLKIYGPGNQEFSEVLCKRCTPSTHMSCPVASSKSWMGNKAGRSCSAVLQAWRHSSQGQGFVCIVSALHHISFLSLSLLPVCVVRNIWKKNSFCFLTLVLKHGRWQLSFRACSSRLWLTVSKPWLSGFASSRLAVPHY